MRLTIYGAQVPSGSCQGAISSFSGGGACLITWDQGSGIWDWGRVAGRWKLVAGRWTSVASYLRPVTGR